MTPEPHPHGRQPLLHDAVVALRAPAQAWSRDDGSMRDSGIDGIYVSDSRVARRLRILVNDDPGEHIATHADGASQVRFVSLHRGLDAEGADPDVRVTVTRVVHANGATHTIALESRRDITLDPTVAVELTPDVADMESIKIGLPSKPQPQALIREGGAEWSGGEVTATASAPGATVRSTGDGIRMTWQVEVPPRGMASVSFELAATDSAAVVSAAPGGRPWTAPETSGGDDRLTRWLTRALDDLDALRLVTSGRDQFFAAGAPWFFTLFGRDALWAARMTLPLGTEMAAGTLRALASLQGAADDVETAEQPGKIPHELRRAPATHADGMTLPPLYYGTVDATPLWVCLLADAHDAGMTDSEVRELLPALRSALAWMRDTGDSDGDGLLEYIDTTGRGLSNQGWKDSGDSVQWRSGALAEGPIALCEVQAYAYEAAMRGADLLDKFGAPPEEAAAWRTWATQLAARFRATFWIEDPAGAYPAIALDAHKRPVDTVTSNLGHLLGTGLLNADEAGRVARRLVSPELDSGFGLRTLSTDAEGYWPLSYHGGSVWAHDTAIAITGLVRDGFRPEAAQLSEGLLRAAVTFDYRLPELYSGDGVADVPAPLPYPAACRPQAWSAAAAVAVWSALR
jgi:glycogen debranching enzyme